MRRSPLLHITDIVDDIECEASSFLVHQHITSGMVGILAWPFCHLPILTTYITCTVECYIMVTNDIRGACT